MTADPFRDPEPDPAAPPPERTPLHDIAWFLVWCRARGYRVGPVLEYGGVRMQVADLRQPKIEGVAASEEPDDMPDEFRTVLRT